jgi:hypothetical protein
MVRGNGGANVLHRALTESKRQAEALETANVAGEKRLVYCRIGKGPTRAFGNAPGVNRRGRMESGACGSRNVGLLTGLWVTLSTSPKMHRSNAAHRSPSPMENMLGAAVCKTSIAHYNNAFIAVED